MDRARFRNINNLDLVEPNRIGDLMYACLKLLFTDLFDAENVAYIHILFDVTSCHGRPGRGICCLHWILLRCILHYISYTNAVHGLSPVQKMFPD